MSKGDKLLLRVLQGTADANIRFSELRHLLTQLGFAERIRGDHHIFTRQGIEPVLKHSILLRNPYVDPIHMLQVRGLRELSREKKTSPEAQSQWLELVRLTIHGVAYGMKSTG